MKQSTLDGAVVFTKTPLELRKEKYARDSRAFNAHFRAKPEAAISFMAAAFLISLATQSYA